MPDFTVNPKTPAVTSDVPSVKISFSIKFHSNITSVLIEMLNNTPDLHDTGSENDEWQLLRKLLSGGSFAGFSQDRANVGALPLTRNKREENVRKRRRRWKMVMFLAKISNILPTSRSLCSLLQTRTKNVQPKRSESVMQPPLPEVTPTTGQKTAPKTRVPARNAKHTLPVCPVKSPISKGDPCSWISVKARSNTILLNQMTRPKAAQSYRDDRMAQPSPAQMILYSVQNKVLRDKASAMTPKRTVLINAMQNPIRNSWSHLSNSNNSTSTFTIRTTADFPHCSIAIPSLKETRLFGLLNTGRETKPCVGVTETANTGQLVTLTECVGISFHFDCGTQTLLLDNDSFWSMLEVLQNEFFIGTERTASDAFRLPSYSADTVSSRDKQRISITVRLPGSKTLQVSSVPVSLLRRLLQRFSEDSMIIFTNRYRSTYNRNFTRSIEAKTFSTGSVSPRCETTVRGLGEWLRPSIIPDEEITAVSETFMEMSIDNDFLPFYKEPEYPGNFATFTRQIKRRPIPEEAVTTVAIKNLEFHEYIQEPVIYQEIYSTEKANVKTITNSDASGVKQDVGMEATNSINREEQDETYGNELRSKEDKVDKKVLNEITREVIGDDCSVKYKLFDDADERRKPSKRYQKRISYNSCERLPTIPEEPEEQDNFTKYEFAGKAAEVNEPNNGARMIFSDHDKFSTSYKQRDHSAFKRERSKEYQEFDVNVPSHLGNIEILFKDITDVVFEKDEEGEPLILSSGGFGDIYQARLADTNETIIVKTIEDMDFEEILRETRIQMYLTPGQYVPAIKGVIAVQGQPEIMILQQFCAGGELLCRFTRNAELIHLQTLIC